MCVCPKPPNVQPAINSKAKRASELFVPVASPDTSPVASVRVTSDVLKDMNCSEPFADVVNRMSTARVKSGSSCAPTVGTKFLTRVVPSPAHRILRRWDLNVLASAQPDAPMDLFTFKAKDVTILINAHKIMNRLVANAFTRVKNFARNFW